MICCVGLPSTCFLATSFLSLGGSPASRFEGRDEDEAYLLPEDARKALWLAAPPSLKGEPAALLIVENAFNCNALTAATCRGSRRAPKKWPTCRTPARARYSFSVGLLRSSALAAMGSEQRCFMSTVFTHVDIQNSMVIYITRRLAGLVWTLFLKPWDPLHYVEDHVEDPNDEDETTWLSCRYALTIHASLHPPKT